MSGEGREQWGTLWGLAAFRTSLMTVYHLQSRKHKFCFFPNGILESVIQLLHPWENTEERALLE